MHLTKCIIKVVARVVNSCYLLAERVGPQFHHSSKLTILLLYLYSVMMMISDSNKTSCHTIQGVIGWVISNPPGAMCLVDLKLQALLPLSCKTWHSIIQYNEYVFHHYFIYQNSPLKLPPDQRLWTIDESMFSEDSSVASLSRKSSIQSVGSNEYEPKTTSEHVGGKVFKTEL